MRSALVVCAVSLAGCASGDGAVIEVHSPAAAIDSIELWIAPRACVTAAGDKCAPGVSWATQMSPIDGEIFTLDADERAEADVVDGVARFELRATSGAEPLARVAVVGYAGGVPAAASVLEDVAVPLDHVERWVLDLAPIDDASPDVTTPPGASQNADRAHIWPTTTRTSPDGKKLASCATFQHWTDAGWTTEAFAPPGDPDCDGEAVECDPYWFEFNLGAAHLPCATSAGPLDLPSCVLGGSLCADGTSSDPTCMQDAAEVCVPDVVCGCGSPLDTSCLSSKLTTALAMDALSPMPFALCRFVPDPANGNGPCTANNVDTQTITLPATPAPCTEVTLRKVMMPLPAGTSTVGAGATTFTVGLESAMPTCTISVRWNGGSSSVFPPTLFLLDIGFGPKDLLLPVKIAFDSSTACVNATVRNCATHFPASDHLLGCAK